jgi:sirohydrochlorin ferrochelatase
MHREKIVASITSATIHLENALQTLTKKTEEKTFANSLWLAAAETEYALFLFSLTRQDESGSSSSKHETTSKQTVEIQPALVSAQDLLKRVKDSMEAGDLVRAYEETWTARNTLLKIEDLLEKKRKSSGAKTTSATIQSP